MENGYYQVEKPLIFFLTDSVVRAKLGRTRNVCPVGAARHGCLGMQPSPIALWQVTVHRLCAGKAAMAAMVQGVHKVSRTRGGL